MGILAMAIAWRFWFDPMYRVDVYVEEQLAAVRQSASICLPFVRMLESYRDRTTPDAAQYAELLGRKLDAVTNGVSAGQIPSSEDLQDLRDIWSSLSEKLTDSQLAYLAKEKFKKELKDLQLDREKGKPIIEKLMLATKDYPVTAVYADLSRKMPPLLKRVLLACALEKPGLVKSFFREYLRLDSLTLFAVICFTCDGAFVSIYATDGERSSSESASSGRKLSSVLRQFGRSIYARSC